MNATRSLLKWILRFILLYVLFIVLFMIGSMPVAGVMPALATSEPGLVPATSGLLIVALADLLVIAALILTSRWSGWKLAVSLALAYYGAVTFVMQIETWYFLSSITVSPQLLPRLFLMGVPTAFLFIPLAVWVLGKGRATADASLPPFIPPKACPEQGRRVGGGKRGGGHAHPTVDLETGYNRGRVSCPVLGSRLLHRLAEP